MTARLPEMLPWNWELDKFLGRRVGTIGRAAAKRGKAVFSLVHATTHIRLL